MLRTRVGLSVLAVLCFATAAVGQERVENWPAPRFWSPPAGPADREDASVRMETAAVATSTSPLPFIGVTPCRLLDTRNNLNPLGGGGPFASDEIRTYTLPGACGLPGGIQAVSLNVTATNTGAGSFGHIKIWPADQTEPNVSTLNYPGAGATVANAAIVPLSGTGALKVKSGNAPADVILDVNGYYGATSSTDFSNVFVGPFAGNSTMTGVLNTGLGLDALVSNSTGNANTAVGALALVSNTVGSQNTAVGSLALVSTSGANNVAVGYSALSGGAGAGNIAIGAGAGTNITTGSNNIYIGNAGSGNESGQIRIGTNGVQTQGTVIASIYGFGSIGGIPVIVNSGGRLGTTTSSRRFKEDIRDIGAESDGLMNLRPVAFRYKREIDPSGLAQYGLIAEEVAEIYPELVAYDAEGRPEAIRSQLLDALLLSELQKQRLRIESQKAEIEDLKAKLAKLEARISIAPTR